MQLRSILASGEALTGDGDVGDVIAFGRRMLRSVSGVLVVYQRAERSCGLLFVFPAAPSKAAAVAEEVERVGRQLGATSGVATSTYPDVALESIPLKWRPELNLVRDERLEESLRFCID